MTALTASMSATPTASIHPRWLRATHWLNALAVLVMVASGWRIYNASPLFDFRFPREVTLGGWLGGALQWHFAGMWLLVVNGLVYLALNAGQRSLRGASSSRCTAARSAARPARRTARAAVARRSAPLQRRAARGLSVRDRRHRCCWCCRAWCCGSRCSSRCCASCWAATRRRDACTSSPWPRWWRSSPVHLVDGGAGAAHAARHDPRSLRSPRCASPSDLALSASTATPS